MFPIASVCFIASHGASADHFATFVENFPKDIARIEIYASGPALKKFEDRGIEVKKFTVDNISIAEQDVLAEEIAKACSATSLVITDVGHLFDAKIHRSLAANAVKALRFAYYDNPEPYVPGGYSSVAADVMLAAQGVIFANSNLANAVLYSVPGKAIDFAGRKKIGLGYYPVAQADKIANRRISERASLRKSILDKNGISEKGQKAFVYFGGNNDEYFGKAFPAFLEFLAEAMKKVDLSNLVFIIQQHPAAKGKNLDGNLVAQWISKHGQMAKAPKMIVSEFNSDDAQVIADAAFYYQTSMGPQFALAGIPAVQIGHNTYEDILVRNRLCPSVTNVEKLIGVLDDLKSPFKKDVPREVIYKGLGIKMDWLKVLQETIENSQNSQNSASFVPLSSPPISKPAIVIGASFSALSACQRFRFFTTALFARINAIFFSVFAFLRAIIVSSN